VGKEKRENTRIVKERIEGAQAADSKAAYMRVFLLLPRRSSGIGAK
jgi:hypothetical protein